MKGTLDIVTTIDGQSTQKTWDAVCELDVHCADIRYRDENALVKVSIKDNKVKISRKGDYGLVMSFEEGKKTPVVLELGGSVGEIVLETYRLGYLLSEKSCMLQLHYALCFSEDEKQEITLRMQAKCI